MLFAQTAHAAGEGISIKLAPYVLGDVFGVPITSTLVTVWVTMALLIIAGILIGRNVTLVPSRAQLAAEALIGTVYDYTADVLESRAYARRYFPLIMTIFIFILTMNWIGLLPGVDAVGVTKEANGESIIPFLHPPATDLNITIAFALVAFIAIEVAGVAAIGFFKYAGKFINFSSPLKFIIGLIELISEIARLIAFSFRLFGNIFAGKTLIVVAMFFVPFILPVPILAFEIFVGFIQAFIFAILTLFFIKLAIEEPH